MTTPASGQPLVIDAVTQRYGTFLAVDNVTLDIKAGELDRKSTRLNSSHTSKSRMPSSA